jgi:catechol 2,3-dioxygenase-like lactoylglutathione lyase family enzyme
VRGYTLNFCEVDNIIKSFDHAAIIVKDFDRTIDWYVNHMGFNVKRRIENKERWTRIAFLKASGQVMLEFFGFSDPKKVVVGPRLKTEETGIKHTSFFVDDMDEMCHRLKKAGIEFTTLTSKRVVFKDPNGTMIELRLL